jgi:predicted KAP-like P-loop ATPase
MKEETTHIDGNEIKYVVKTLLFILFVSVFGDYLIGQFDRYIVNQLICTIYERNLSLLKTIITLALSFYSLYYIAIDLGKKRYIVRFGTIVFLSIPILIYANQRFFNNRYDFTTIFGSNSSIYFLDFPFFLLAFAVFVLIINRFYDKKTQTENDLLIDLPLKLIEHDKFERRLVYESLIKQIVNISFDQRRSFSIGIVNKWAEGKTSFLNFIEEDLKKDKEHTVIVKFNAWFTSKSDNLTNDFFDTLDEELSKYIYTGSLLRRYANNLTQINSIFNPFKYLPPHLVHDKANQSYFNQIEALLKRLNKRIFIFIDDLDRLDNIEVFNVFRLIRNSANFPYIIFLVPFDKQYALHALSENKIYNPKEYIKKIFDLEISLTPIAESYLEPIFIGILCDFIERKLDTATADDIDKLTQQINAIFLNIGVVNSNSPKYSAINSYLFKIVKNNRDIVRLTNSIKLSLKHNFNKLYLPDLIILELIKYESAETYRRLFENMDYLKVTESDGRKRLNLYAKSDDTDDIIFDLLQGNIEYYNILDELDKEFLELVKALFEEPEAADYNKNLSICYDANFMNYIQYKINGISYDELNDLIDG